MTWSDLKPRKAALMTTINRMRQVSKIAAQQDVHVVVRVLYRYRSGCRATAAYNSNNYKQATRVTIIFIKSPIDEQSYRHRFQTIGLWDLLRINGNSFDYPSMLPLPDYWSMLPDQKWITNTSCTYHNVEVGCAMRLWKHLWLVHWGNNWSSVTACYVSVS